MRLFAACLLLLLACLGVVAARSRIGSPGVANAHLRSSSPGGWGRVPLHFEQNRGQANAAVAFLSRGSGYLVGLGATEATLVLSRGHGAAGQAGRGTATAPARVALRLAGADPKAIGTPLQPLPGKVNYFLGNDPRKWRTNVPTFGRVQYTGVYPGIDLVYYGNQQQLEYDFVVRPGADPGRIRFCFGASSRPKLSAEGELLIPCGSGMVRQKRPAIYQKQHGRRLPVSGSYRVAQNGIVGFDLGSYDPKLPLVIDPVLTYASFLGGSQADRANAIAVDADGSCYVGGNTWSADFPNTLNIQEEKKGVSDAFLVKLDPTGTALEYATFFGGSGVEAISALSVTVDETVYFVGDTTSTDLPVIAPFQATSRGQYEAFVAKLSPEGDALVYSTYLGGSDLDSATNVDVDASGNAYVVGGTQSVDFPTQNPFIIPHTYSGRGFIAELNPQGSALVYASQLGDDTGSGISAVAVDATGAAYVAGAAGLDFPWVNPMFLPDPAGGHPFTAFVAKVNPTGSGFIYATPVEGTDRIRDLKIDASGTIYCVGNTVFGGHATPNVVQPEQHGNTDGFIFRINAAGNAIDFATYLGGSGYEELTSLDLDPAGNVYVTGRSNSTDFPLVSPLQGAFAGGYEGDLVVAKLNSTGTSLLYSTYLGAAGDETGWGIAVDSSSSAYVVGSTSSFNFPTVRAYQPTYRSGSMDAVVLKIGGVLPPNAPSSLTAVATGQKTVHLNWSDASSDEEGFQVERKFGTANAPGAFARITQTLANQIQFIDTGLSPGTVYSYRVRAVNEGGPSLYTGAATVTTFPGPPAPPTNLTVRAVSQTQLELHWTDASDNETQFEVVRQQGVGEFQSIALLEADRTSYLDQGLTAATLYSYQVRAINLGGASAYSPGAAAATLPYPPTAPGSLQVAAVSTTQLELHWVDQSSNETQFEVYRRKGSGEYSLIALLGEGANTYLDVGLASNAAMTYRVRAVNEGGASDYTSPQTGLTRPAPPVGLTLQGSAPGGVRLGWADPNPSPAAHRIERRPEGGTYAPVATVAAGTATYLDGTASPSGIYSYRVWATNSSGDSDSAPEAQISLTGGKLQVRGTVNFGKVSLSTSSSRSLTLKNQSRTEPLRVTIGQATAPFQRSVGGTFTLAPGAKQVVLIAFQPPARGQAKGTLEITSSDPAKPLVMVRLTGAGK